MQSIKFPHNLIDAYSYYIQHLASYIATIVKLMTRSSQDVNQQGYLCCIHSHVCTFCIATRAYRKNACIPCSYMCTHTQLCMHAMSQSVSHFMYQPGVVAAVAYQGDTLLSLGYGTIKKGTQTVPNGDTIFRIGSITKVFVVSIDILLKLELMYILCTQVTVGMYVHTQLRSYVYFTQEHAGYQTVLSDYLLFICCRCWLCINYMIEVTLSHWMILLLTTVRNSQ